MCTCAYCVCVCIQAGFQCLDEQTLVFSDLGTVCVRVLKEEASGCAGPCSVY